MLAISSPYPQFFGLDGKPLDGGALYFGTENLDPETNPITVYWDAAGTIVASQPVPTLNGYAVRNGAPATVYAATNYSLNIRNRQSVLVAYSPSSVDASNLTVFSTGLAGTASAAQGAGQVGFLYSLAYGAGTVGKWLKDLATSAGATFIGWIQAGAGAVLRTIQDKLREWVSVKDFGAVGDGTADDTAAIAAAWTASKSLIFPAGTYKVTSLPNFATNGARVRGIGKVTINFIGTGNVLAVDAGSTPGVNVYDVELKNLTLRGTASATNGFYIRGVVHSRFRDLRVFNVTAAGARCEFMVCNTFDGFTVSGNEGGFTTTPLRGIVLEKRGTGEQCSANTFSNYVIEGTSGDGIYAPEAAMNTFTGGTSEGNGFGGGAGGIYLGPNSFGNTFINPDLEHNGVLADATSYHVKDYGLRNKFITPFCDATLSGLFWAAGGNSCSIDGGQIADLKIDAGVKNFQTRGMAYTGTITDNGTDTRHIQRFSVAGAAVDVVDSQMATTAWTPTVSGLTVVGTPTYAGKYQRMGKLVVFTIQVTSTTSTANPGGANFTLPVAAATLGTCTAASNNTGLGLGAGSGSISSTLCYPPTWSADSNVTITGFYFAA